MSSDLLKFNKQGRSRRSIFFLSGLLFPHYKYKYIIKKGSAICFQLPSNHSEIVSEEMKSHRAEREEARFGEEKAEREHGGTEGDR